MGDVNILWNIVRNVIRRSKIEWIEKKIRVYNLYFVKWCDC